MPFSFFTPDRRSVKKIAISRTDKIGDLILSIPAFYMTRKMYPQAHITAIVREYNAPVVRGLSFIDEVFALDGKHGAEIDKRIKTLKPDIFAALYSDAQTAAFALKSGAKIRVGPLSKPTSWISYNRGIIQNRSRSVKNEAEYNLDIIRRLDPQKFDRLYEIGGRIAYGPENAKAAGKFLAGRDVSGPFILMHPFGGGSAKNFTPCQYGKLAVKIANALPEVPIIVSSSPEEEKKLMESARYFPDNAVYFVNGPDIMDLAALIDRCEVYVGGSTGPSHLAGNLRKKAVLVYPAKASQSPVRWGLFGDADAEYVVPDDENPKEDYSKKAFDKVDDNLLDNMAEKVVNKLRTVQPDRRPR